MTTERELLELAAKACGLAAKYTTENSKSLLAEGPWNPLLGKHCWYWNPLADDGDCARMEAQLGLSILWFKDYVLSGKGRLHQVIDCEDHNGDKNAARRAASVAVASEIGRALRAALGEKP